MSETRFNPITGEPVILATERAERPGAWSNGSEKVDVRTCPFCPGNESETPAEIQRTGGETWTARVVPNKYPLVSGPEHPRHEVLIDSRDHNQRFEEMSSDQLRTSLRLWNERSVSQEGISGTKYVSLFRNEGRAAGQSIAHPHSQILGLDFVPPRIARELEAFRSDGVCPMCKVVETESARREMIIDRHEGLILFCPRASRVPFEMWIAPLLHESDWRESKDAGLADLLLSGTRRLRSLHPHAAFNIGVVTAPLRTDGAERFHWYVEIIPRLTNVAGYEISAGGWINIESPERAAKQLRERDVRPD